MWLCIRNNASDTLTSRSALYITLKEFPHQVFSLMAPWTLQLSRATLSEKNIVLEGQFQCQPAFQPHRMWKTFDRLLGYGRMPPTDINVSVLHKFFDDKTAAVHTATVSDAEPTFQIVPPGCELRLFTPVTETTVIQQIQALPDKQSSLDLLPTWLLKTNMELLALFLCHLFNWFLEHDTFPSHMKSAYITKEMTTTKRKPI